MSPARPAPSNAGVLTFLMLLTAALGVCVIVLAVSLSAARSDLADLQEQMEAMKTEFIDIRYDINEATRQLRDRGKTGPTRR